MLGLFHISLHLIIPTILRQAAALFPFHGPEKVAQSINCSKRNAAEMERKPKLGTFPHWAKKIFFKSYYFLKVLL